jgi:hypothetical protein
MTRFRYAVLVFCLLFVLLAIPGTVFAQTATAPAPEPTIPLNWEIVVNNGVQVPGDTRNFNSYNQPSVNINNFVVFRARSKGGQSGEPAHGVFSRDMKPGEDGVLPSVQVIFDRTKLVPEPNNLSSMFIEPPAFPRLDIYTNAMASRANHQPMWEYSYGANDLTTDSRAGTTGIYATPFGTLVTGASNLGGSTGLTGFEYFKEPTANVKFDVFPGAPAVDGNKIVFKGNYTDNGVSKTGVYYRVLTNDSLPERTGNPGAGSNKVVVIANTGTVIPGTSKVFGSTAPPSAANGRVVFAGFDNEDAPTAGGIYLAQMTGPKPPLEALVKIGDPVPGVNGAVFNKLGEGLSFDGRFVAYWGAWGTATKELTLQCPAEGNKERQAYCLETYPNGFVTNVPVNQGIFVIDITKVKGNRLVARTPNDFSDFVYLNLAGLVPGTGGGEDDGEPARWRSASFVAVSGQRDYSLTDATYHAAFKARTGNVLAGAAYDPATTIDGIYLRKGPGTAPMTAVVKSKMLGTLFDPGASYVDEVTGNTVVLPVTEMGIERDGFRGNTLAINISMGTEEAGFAGIYLTHVPDITY